MACSSCGTSGGCSTKEGSSGCGKSGGCSSGGCNKMNSFDWLADMELMDLPIFDVVEVRFKGGRKDFFRNNSKIELYTGDPVVIEVQGGHHIGYVSLQGELVRLQMQKRNVLNNDQIKQIYRKANEKDLEKFENARNREPGTLFRTRNIINELKLAMKLTDVEYQADNTKATFYYSAEDRVDFRELIKQLATEFKVRVEMKQISLRQEAGRLGGIGSCGRELCCSTWLVDFKNVSTTAARYQNLSLNPSKLSGQCGRLKCCLNYELDTYMDALKTIPEVEKPLKTQRGEAVLQKTDIFRRIMWFGYKDESTWYQLSIDRVNEILDLNKMGQLPATLESNEQVDENSEKVSREKIELSRFDDKFKKNNRKKKNKSSHHQNRNQNAVSNNLKVENINSTTNDRNTPKKVDNRNNQIRRESRPNTNNQNNNSQNSNSPRPNNKPKQNHRHQPKRPPNNGQGGEKNPITPPSNPS